MSHSVLHPKFKFKFIYSHLFKFVQYNNNKKKKEVKTELAIHWIKHNKRKKCVAAKGAKLSGWLLPQGGYKWVEVIQTTNVIIQARNHKKTE